PPQLLAERPRDRVADIRVTALQHDQPRGDVRHRLEDQALHARRLAPVPVDGLDHELDAWRERDEAIRAGADRRLLEPIVAHTLDVLLRDDPARARRD